MSNMNENVANLLQNQEKLIEITNLINNCENSYLPNISNNIGKIATGINTIAKNTTNIDTKLDKINETIKNQKLNIIAMNSSNYNSLVKKLRQVGIYRLY